MGMLATMTNRFSLGWAGSALALVMVALLPGCGGSQSTDIFGDASPPVMSTTDGSSSAGSGGNGGAGATGGMGGAGVASSTSGATGTGGGQATKCDADGDGFLSMGMCEGSDCDDMNMEVNPGAAFHTYARPGFSGKDPLRYDWNCDGAIEIFTGEELYLHCSEAKPIPVASPCLDYPGQVGWLANSSLNGTGPSSCGDWAPWGTCVPVIGTAGCTDQVMDPHKTMACR